MATSIKNLEENGFDKDYIKILNMKNPTGDYTLLTTDIRKNDDDVSMAIERVEYSFDELLGAAPGRPGPERWFCIVFTACTCYCFE